jgi:hypothetical protein
MRVRPTRVVRNAAVAGALFICLVIVWGRLRSEQRPRRAKADEKDPTVLRS